MSYRESLAGAKIDPSPIWTGSWRDARFSPPADGGLPENAVTGTFFGVKCCTAAAAISVPQAVAGQPFWRNTRIAALTPGTTTQLAAGSLGPIWDEVPSSPDQPPGVSQLSLTTLTVTERVLDEGSSFGPGTATHAIALHRDPSGAWVFSAGTAQWSWGLDGTHDGGASAPDVAMQQATVNLLFDMGALPRSLQPGLLPGDADTTPPVVSVSGPTAGAAVAGTISVTANATDNVSVASVRFFVDGVAIGTANVAPYAVAWNTTTIGNGSHTLTATALDPSGNLGSSGAVVVTVANPVAPTIDAMAFGDRSTASRTLASSAFSTTAGTELLLAFISADDTATGQTVSSISGGSLTWTLVRRTNVRRGDSEIWRAFATGVLSNVTVTATLSQSAAASITVVSFKGVDTSGTNGSGAIGASQSSSSAAGAPTATLTTTRAASLVFGVGNDWDRATGRTVGSNQTLVHQYLATVGDTFWVQRLNSASSAAGVGLTISDSAPTGDQYNLTLCEILPSSPDITAPVVSVSAPAPGATVSGNSVTVSATGSDNVGIAGVQFLLDGTALGAEDTVSPFSISWNTTTANSGSHTLTARARDAAGNTTTSGGVTVTVNNDATAPTVSVTAPSAGANVSGTSVTVAATATDNVGVVGVQFLLDGVALGAEDTSAPYSTSWDSTTASNGSHTLTARARDAAGNATTSAGVTVTATNDTAAPTVSVTAPSAGANVSGSTVAVSATANDNVGIAGVQFLLDGAALGVEDTTSPYSIIWDSTAAAAGSHTLAARARDTAGNATTSASVAVTVNNDVTAPSVNVTAPTAGASVSGTSVTVSASASDNVGVVGVQFLLDDVALGTEDTSNPYSTIWNSTLVSNGSHTLTARARDAAGNTKTSAGINVTVTNDTTAPTVSVTAPSGGATISGAAVTVSATANDNVAVVGVQFLLDGAAIAAEDTSSPYSISWNSTTATSGSHALAARARDAAGNTTTSASVTVTVSNDSTPPAVTVTAPSSGATVSGTVVTVSATASDAVGVVGVQFLLDGVALGTEDTTNPYSTSWNSTTASNGSHTLTARARDAAGNATTSAGVTVTVSNDTTAPTVLITAPSGGATVSGSVTLSATASDNVSVVGVQFLVDGVAVNTEDTSSPYSRTWTTTTGGNGTHTVSARARDAAGNTTTSTGVTVTVANDTTAPDVSISAPAAGATVSGTSVTVSASASDNVGIVGVQFLLDGSALGTEDTSSPFSRTWNTTTASNGNHTLTARARDAAGNSKTSTAIAVTVSNDSTAPTVSISTPAAGTVVSGTTVSVSASASDNVGVVGVQFLLDGASLGAEDTTSPYAITWNSTSATDGSHTLSARARDGAGNTRLSSSVSVTVQNAMVPPPTVSITSPTNGATVSSPFSATATASSSVGIAGVQFSVDGVTAGSEITAAPYTAVLAASNGTHVITATARDTGGRTTVSSGVTVTVSGQTAFNGSDTFSAPLNTNNWAIMDREGDLSNAELQCYTPANQSVANDSLTLTIKPQNITCNGHPYSYTSSMVQWRSFNFTYGTVEVRAKFPGGTGPWPAIWLLGANCQASNIVSADNTPPCNWPKAGSDEIDIAEVPDNGRSQVNQQIHSASGDPGCKPTVSDTSLNYHVYRLEWAPGSVTWKIDGVQTCRVTSGVPSTPMFLLLNIASHGTVAGLPQSMIVDYVTVTQP